MNTVTPTREIFQQGNVPANNLHFAVVVGIDRYPSLQSLTAARTDAQEFYRWVTASDGGNVPRNNAYLVQELLPSQVTAREAEPTTQAIYSAFESCMDAVREVATQDWPRTRLYFFGAGHGIAPDARDSALLAANVTQRTYGHHVSCASLLEFFARVQLFHELALFADCCRLYPPREVKRMPPYFTEDTLENGTVCKVLGCGAIFGRKAFEETEPAPDERRGYFTRALLDGLRGAPAAVAPSGHVTAHLLSTHVHEHMRRATEKKFLKPLEPDFVLEGGGDRMTFGPPRDGPSLTKHPVSITVSDTSVTRLDVAPGPHGAPVEMSRTTSASNTFSIDLAVGLYEALPNGASVAPPAQPWTFKVQEGGVHVHF